MLVYDVGGNWLFYFLGFCARWERARRSSTRVSFDLCHKTRGGSSDSGSVGTSLVVLLIHPRLHEHGGHGGAHGRVGDEHRRVKVLSLVDELRKGQTPREGGARELILRRLTVERGHD